MIHSLHHAVQVTMRKLFLASALSVFAMPVSAQVGAPFDSSGYVASLGPASAGGVERFAQTFQRPAAGFNWLQSFTFRLGDVYANGSGTGLVFQAAVYTVTGSQLGSQLFLSGMRNGSGNFDDFDPYTFASPNLFLDPTIDTFALVLQSVYTQNGALNVIAGSATDYAGGAIYSVDDLGTLTAVDGTSDVAFDATLTPSSVPEPATFVLFATGLSLVGLAGARRRQA